MHKHLFGDVFFRSNGQDAVGDMPFYLRRFYEIILSNWHLENRSNNLYNGFSGRIPNKTIALLATGILKLDEAIIQELNEFDEIIPLAFTTKHYKDFPHQMKISYHNGGNSLRLISDNQFSEGVDLDVLSKVKVTN